MPVTAVWHCRVPIRGQAPNFAPRLPMSVRAIRHHLRMDNPNADALASIERERLHLLVEADIDGAAAFHADDFQLITPTGRPLS